MLEKRTTPVLKTVRDALDAAAPRPERGSASDKKNYAERLSRNLATVVANALRPDFPGIIPEEDGKRQESKARSSKGAKKLDVNFSTIELGLGLGVSIKTLNFRDEKSSRYTKNFTRIDNELRAEAQDYHERQPYAVLVAVIFLPADAAEDAQPKPTAHSSFGGAVKIFRHRAGRTRPKEDVALFERVFVALYRHDGEGDDTIYFDVNEAPPRIGPPTAPSAISFAGMIEEIRRTYRNRNAPPFRWADGSSDGDADPVADDESHSQAES